MARERDARRVWERVDVRASGRAGWGGCCGVEEGEVAIYDEDESCMPAREERVRVGRHAALLARTSRTSPRVQLRVSLRELSCKIIICRTARWIFALYGSAGSAPFEASGLSIFTDHGASRASSCKTCFNR